MPVARHPVQFLCVESALAVVPRDLKDIDFTIVRAGCARPSRRAQDYEDLKQSLINLSVGAADRIVVWMRETTYSQCDTVPSKGA